MILLDSEVRPPDPCMKRQWPTHHIVIRECLIGPHLFNASNFDTFVTDINQYKVNFDIISIAETNVDEEHEALYQMNGYSSE